jgi:hypothetical protein
MRSGLGYANVNGILGAVHSFDVYIEAHLVSAAPIAEGRLPQETNILTLEITASWNCNVKILTPSKKNRSGRPPKFTGPRRPITVTLPEDTLNRLAAIDSDRARAIVKAAESAVPPEPKAHNPIEIVEVADGLGIIIVGPSKQLEKIEGVRMVEVAPLRYLLTIPLGTSIDSFALAVIDAVESGAVSDDRERLILSELRSLIHSLRRKGGLSKAEMLFVDTRRFPKETTSVKQMHAGVSSQSLAPSRV